VLSGPSSIDAEQSVATRHWFGTTRPDRYGVYQPQPETPVHARKHCCPSGRSMATTKLAPSITRIDSLRMWSSNLTELNDSSLA
jgi:hypothetical protein